jgi:hypothetical protein
MIWMKAVGRLLNLAAIVIFAYTIALNIPNQVIHLRPDDGRWVVNLEQLLIAVGVAGVGSGLLVLYYWLDVIHPRDAVAVVPPKAPLPMAAFTDAFNQLDATLSTDERLGLSSSALALWDLNTRTTEEIVLGDSRITRKVTRTLRPPEQLTTGTWYLPALRHRKGRLIEDLHVQVSGGSQESVPFLTNVGLSLIVTQDLFCDSVGRSRSEFDADEQYLLKLALREVANPRPRSQTVGAAEVRGQIRKHWKIKSGEVLKPQQSRFLRAFNYLCDYYIVFATQDMANATKQLELICTYSEGRAAFRRSMSNRLRRYLGLQVYHYKIAIPESVDAASYHLHTNAPDGTYLWSLVPRFASKGSEQPKPSELTDQLIGPTFGTAFVHYYSRYLGLAFRGSEAEVDVERTPESRTYRLRGLHLDMQFKPVPPGLSAPITVLSIYLSIIVSVLAIYQQKIFYTVTIDAVTGAPHVGSQSTNAVLSIVLALPAIMSAWVASRFDQKGLRLATPILVFELLSLLTISLLAVGVAAFKVTGGGPGDEAPTSHLTFLAEHPTWAVLWVLSIAHTLLVTATLASRLARYGRALKRAEKLRMAQSG